MEFEFISANKNRICSDWFKYLTDSYPPESGKFFAENKDRFSNPVSAAFSENLPTIFDCIACGSFSGELNAALENILKVRAVQDFSPSKALDFIFVLKKIVNGIIGEQHVNKQNEGMSEEFSDRVDKAALIAFDIYVRLREKIFELKYGEEKQRFGRFIAKIEEKYGSKENEENSLRL